MWKNTINILSTGAWKVAELMSLLGWIKKNKTT
jgi:hypothetical protein